MKVIIPVAGAGTRLQPHTFTQPKVMLPVGNKPMLAHILDSVVPLEPEEVVLVTGAMGEVIREYVDATYQFSARFVHQEELLGLGFALHLALCEMDTGPLLVILGDTIVEGDLKAMCNAGDYVLGLRQVDDPHRFGIAEVSGGYVVGLEEKPPEPKSNLALIGLYYFSESAMLQEKLAKLVQAERRTQGEIQLTDALHDMIDSGVRFVPFEVAGWLDCGKKETLLATNRHLLGQLPPAADIEGSAVIRPVYVAPSAKIISSVIGPYVSISEKAVIENSILRDVIVGAGSQVINSVLEQSLIGANAVVTGQAQMVNVGDKTEIRTC